MKLPDNIAIKPVGLAMAVFYAVAIVLLYHSALSQLVLQDWSREDYSHCIFVPFVVLYLLWEKRSSLKSIDSLPSWQGMVPFAAGMVLFWLGELGGEFFALYLSLWLVIVGLVWLHTGRAKMKHMAFPFLFMLTMFPLPNFAHIRFTLKLKLLSSQLGVWFLHLFGMTAYREGNIIDLGFTKLQVVDACSGLRYVIPLLALSLLMSYWMTRPFWKRALVVLSSVPVAIFVNGFRIAATGILHRLFGPVVAEGFYHDFAGWLIFALALPLMMLEVYLIRLAPPTESGRLFSITQRNSIEGETLQNRKIEADKARGLIQPRFLAAISVLLLSLCILNTVDFRHKIPLKESFSRFPMHIGEWQGTAIIMEKQFLDALAFSDYILADYKDKKDKTVNFYVAYYQDQSKGESIHSPETCIPGGGWTFRDAGEYKVLMSDGKSFLSVNKAVIEKEGQKEITYFWFPQRGRILTRLYQLKAFTFWDALTRQRTDGALVRVITPVYQSEQTEDAERRLQDFIRQITPVLETYIPGKNIN